MIYRSLADINIYDSPQLDRLATQMAKSRYLQVLETEPNFLKIQLLEDGYEGLFDCQDFKNLEVCGWIFYVVVLLFVFEI